MSHVAAVRAVFSPEFLREKGVLCPNGHRYSPRAEANCGVCRRLPTVETGQFDRARLRHDEFLRREAVEREDNDRRSRMDGVGREDGE